MQPPDAAPPADPQPLPDAGDAQGETVGAPRPPGGIHRRLARAALVLLPVLALTLVAVSVAERSLPPAWRAELNRYLAYKSGVLSADVQVLRVARASRPWQFGADGSRPRDLSRVVLGDRTYFQVDRSYSGDERYGFQPLPFPPQEVYCVLLRRGTGAGGLSTGVSYAVVFVALHQDLYNAAWVVHEGPPDPFAPALAAGLSRIGCDLSLSRPGSAQQARGLPFPPAMERERLAVGREGNPFSPFHP